MKFTITSYHALATWKWDTSTEPHKLYHYAKSGSGSGNDAGGGVDDDDDGDEDDVCGICRLAYESCCPDCKVPGDDCPLIWGECTHIFHMHCLLKWIGTESSKHQCPMDRRPWVTADRKPDQLPTTVTGAPVATVAPGPLPHPGSEEEGEADAGAGQGEGEGGNMEVDEARQLGN